MPDDRDEIILEHVYQFLDLLLDCRKEYLIELFSTRQGKGLIKAEAVEDIIGTTVERFVPERNVQRVLDRVSDNLKAVVKDSYFNPMKEEPNGGGDRIFKRSRV